MPYYTGHAEDTYYRWKWWKRLKKFFQPFRELRITYHIAVRANYWVEVFFTVEVWQCVGYASPRSAAYIGPYGGQWIMVDEFDTSWWYYVPRRWATYRGA